MKVAPLLGLRGPWRRGARRARTASAAGVTALAEALFEPLLPGGQKASLASVSPGLPAFRHLAGSLAWGPSLVQHVRHMEGPPGPPKLRSSVHPVFDAPPSLLFSCR